MKVTCSLDYASISNAIKQLEDFKRSLPNKAKELAERLAQIGVNAAQQSYGGAVDVHAEPGENGYTIYAEGDAVCFLEFGTGMYADNSNADKYQDLSFTVAPGSWSEGPEGKHLYSEWLETHDSLEGWNYRGLPLNHQPRPGMFNAYQAIVNALQAEAKKVFQ